MKKVTIARFMTCGAALFAAFGLAACGAETGAPGAEGVGSSEQAIGIGSLAAGYEGKYPAYLKISATEALVVGGYDHTGAAVKTIKKATYTGGTFTFASVIGAGSTAIQLGTARGEEEIAPIPGQANKFYVVGGRSTDNGTRLSSLEIIDLNGTPSVAAVTDTLASARVNFKLVACGDHLLAVGGDDGSPSTKLEVIKYNSGTPDVDTMRNKDNTATVVTLNTARKFLGALPISSTKVIVFGGNDGSNVLDSTELLNVNSSCQFNDLDAMHNLAVATAGNDMPDVREKFAASLTSISVGGVVQEAIVAGGKDTISAPLATFTYNDGASTAAGTWTDSGTPTLVNPHIRPIFAPAVVSGAGDFALIGGESGLPTGGDISTVQVDYFTGTTVASVTDLTTAREAGWGAYLNGTYFAGMGVTRTYSAPNYTETWLTTNE